MATAAIAEYMAGVGARARAAARHLSTATTQQKNAGLAAISAAIRAAQGEILAGNAEDLARGRARGLEPALLDRLELTDARFTAMVAGVEQVAELPDPCGAITDLVYRPSGIQVGRLRVPLGVVGIIYESRPNVTADAASLCLKSGNAAILRGGSEALACNRAIGVAIAEGLRQSGLPEGAVQIINTADRDAVGVLLGMSDSVDVLVPRGGRSLIERVAREARMPVIKHLDGICHVYVDELADRDKALAIALNAKTHRYGVCNAMETLLLHRAVMADLWPRLLDAYISKGVELRGCPEVVAASAGAVAPAEESDWSTEYLAPILSVKVVDDMAAAIEHINHYGSQHTDALVSESISRARRFMLEVDSSSVMINASTRFADGFEFGLGAEIGISTDKFHARGPVGLEGLTSQKWIVLGDGHVRV